MISTPFRQVVPRSRALNPKLLNSAVCFLLGVIAIPLFALADNGQAIDQLRYTIRFDQAANHYVQVELLIRNTSENQEVFMAGWTPGSYLIREYAQHVDSVLAADKDGNAIELSKISKNRWKLLTTEAQEVRLSYRVYCNELSVRTNFVDRDFALLNGAGVFLTAENYADKEHVVTLLRPEAWAQSITALERRVELGADTFVAASFDELVDSPIVAGNPSLHAFEVGGVQHTLVNHGGDGLWDGEKAAADVSKIVAVHQAMWGQVPYPRYYFMNVIAEAGGGLEHDNSTVMLTSRWSYRDPSRYKSWLGLVSHEFFHTWNVRRLRPRGLTKYDYEVENYFDELWVAEGVTSYYDDLGLVRAGLTSKQEYLAALSKQINTLQTTDGRFKQSLAQSSHDAWIKFYRPNENSRNTTISYYNKGAIVAFLLDIEIRRQTNNAHSLDDVMRSLYADFALKDGYTTHDVVNAVDTLTGGDYADWFQRTVFSTEELDYDSALDWLGLRFSHWEAIAKSEEKDSSTEDATEDPLATTSESRSSADKSRPTSEGPKPVIWTGLSTRSDGGKLMVSSVSERSPAFDAGFNVGDEILAINNFRASESFTSRLEQFRSEGGVDVLIARRGVLSTLRMPFELRPSITWKLQIVKDPTDKQKANLDAWLHQLTNSD